MEFKKCMLVMIGIAISTSIFASDVKSMDGFFIKPCNEFNDSYVSQRIKTLNPNFQWFSPNCKIVATKSIFPRKNANGIQFEKGIQLFVYQNNKLKFICLPSVPNMICESWTHNN